MDYLRNYLNEMEREAKANRERDERLSDLQQKELEAYKEDIATKEQGFLIDAGELSGFKDRTKEETPVSLANEITRENQLHALIWRVYQSLCGEGKKATAHDIWKEVKSNGRKHDEGEILNEVTNDEILWTSTYGNEQRFKRRSLDSLLTRLKKNPPF
ncbi:hypothetical protein [Methylotuvimicrobium sp. KM2]|uniref:hypothetical protein n=1 Tax=Methylotuvimicrobium sp. KM2 TaxID=3133976 RepID=UPI0031017B67